MKNETIVDRVVERIKKQPLGDLISEEDLHDIVKEAIPKAFFENRVIRDPQGYSSRDKTVEPLIVEVVRDCMRESATTFIRQWFTENQPTLVDYWQKVLDEGLLAYVQKIQDEQATREIRNSFQIYVQRINEERVKTGLPVIYP